MKYKGIIFDLDGVLVHTDMFHYKAWKIIADALGIYFDEKINNRLRGVSRMDSLDIILEGYKGTTLTYAEKEKLASDKNREYRKMLEELSPADMEEGGIKLLDYLCENGIKMAVGSSSKNAPYIIKRLDIEDYFDAVSDGNNISKSKPDPEVFLKAADMLSLKPEDCLVVEDAIAGVDAAINGGFDCAGIGDAAGDSRIVVSVNDLNGLLEFLK